MDYKAEKRIFLANHESSPFSSVATIYQYFWVLVSGSQKRGFTQLRFLESGSVILFGSCLNNKFALDTVFVVDRYYEIESLTQIS